MGNNCYLNNLINLEDFEQNAGAKVESTRISRLKTSHGHSAFDYPPPPS